MDGFKKRVRKRAYRLWQQDGCPEGRPAAHWEMARELAAIEDNQKLATKPVPRDAAARAAAGLRRD
jgi:hypothetical protein